MLRIKSLRLAGGYAVPHLSAVPSIGSGCGVGRFQRLRIAGRGKPKREAPAQHNIALRKVRARTKPFGFA